MSPLSPGPITVHVETGEAGSTLRVAGEVDLLTVGELQQPLDAAIARGGRVTLDVSRIEFIDSTGLRLLLETRGRAERRRGTELELVLGESLAVRRLLELTGVLDLFSVA